MSKMENSTSSLQHPSSAASPFAADKELVEDFSHLGIAVQSDTTDRSAAAPEDIARAAARAAAIKHAQPVCHATSEESSVNAESRDVSEAYHERWQRSQSNIAHPPQPSTNDGTSTPAYTSSINTPSVGDTGISSAMEYCEVAPDQNSNNVEMPREVRPKNLTSTYTQEERMAKPVTHETVKIQNTEIRQKVIHKEIHEYHEVTRILPVIDREVLPARHFIMTKDGKKVEIPEPAVSTGSITRDTMSPNGGDSMP